MVALMAYHDGSEERAVGRRAQWRQARAELATTTCDATAKVPVAANAVAASSA
jgi:hypothetical protein